MNQILCKAESFQMNIEKDDFNFAEQLESVYPLLDIIFEYLNDRDLDNVMKVKKSWKELAQKILKKRSKPCWLTYYPDRGNIFSKTSGNLHFNNASATILLYGGQYNPNEFIPSCERKNLDHMKLLTSRESLVSILNCPKVVSCFSLDNNNKKGSIIDGLVLPVIPGVRISMFHCNFSKLKRNPTLLESHIKANEEVKCLLLFDDHDLRSSIDNLFQIILKETQPEEIALGGGIIHGIKIVHNGEDVVEKLRNETFCLAFTKERNTEIDFNASSYVVCELKLSGETLNEKLQKFRKTIIMRKTSIAFRICCQAKKGKKRETAIFKSHFPNTLLIGLEAGGEIGWNCFNLPCDEVTEYPVKRPPKRLKIPYPKYQHEWSSVFIVITWGDII